MPRGGGSSERARPGLGRSSRAGRGVAPGGRPAAPRAPALSPAHLHGFLEHRHPGGSGPRSASAPQAPRSGSGPASPGSFKLTSDRYRGLGGGEEAGRARPEDARTEHGNARSARGGGRKSPKAAGNARQRPERPEEARSGWAWLPTGSRRGRSETPEPWERATAAGKARRRPERPEEVREVGGRGSQPEVVEDGRRLPSRRSARRFRFRWLARKRMRTRSYPSPSSCFRARALARAHARRALSGWPSRGVRCASAPI